MIDQVMCQVDVAASAIEIKRLALPRGLPGPFDFSNLTGWLATDVSHSFPYRPANLYERGAANPADLSGIPSVPAGAKGWLQHRSHRATRARFASQSDSAAISMHVLKD